MSTSGETTESSEGPGCEPGTLGCVCTDSFTCGAGLSCYVNTCIECEAGAKTCPCRYEDGVEKGECDEGLFCFGGLCAAPQPCPFQMDGKCDEPQGTGVCLPGTDSFDCCPTLVGVCEEESQGGRCPDGSDPLDCGHDTDGDETGTTTDSGTSEDTGTTGTGTTGQASGD
jgi:hypothetical protein